MDRAGFSEWSGDDLAEMIGQVHALEAATRATMLQLVRAFERSEAWREDGATSVTAWLTYRLGLSQRTAAEWVRIASSLGELPRIAAAFAEGLLSWDQLRAVVSMATSDTDAGWAERAPTLSAVALEALARQARGVAREQAEAAHARRCLRWRWDHDHQWLRLSGRLADADGAVVVAALDRLAEQKAPDPVTGMYELHQVRAADALVELASTRLGADADADRATVVVHVGAEALAGGAGNAVLEDGPAISGHTARRLACDARLQLVVDGLDGQPVGVGRTARTVPPWLARMVRRRDRGCRFPGCGRTRWTHAHHRCHWADGGPTDLDDLVQLCSHHHHLIHSDAWRIEGDAAGPLRYVRPDGRPLADHPPPLGRKARDHLNGRFPPDLRQAG